MLHTIHVFADVRCPYGTICVRLAYFVWKVGQFSIREKRMQMFNLNLAFFLLQIRLIFCFL